MHVIWTENQDGERERWRLGVTLHLTYPQSGTAGIRFEKQFENTEH